MTKYVKRAYPVLTAHGPASRPAALSGCLGCPCADKKAAGLSGCLGCPSARTCSGGAGLGFTLQDNGTDTSTDPAGGFTIAGIDWKLALLALAVLFILAQMYFGSDERRDRRKALKLAADSYRSKVRKIKAAA